MSEHDLEEALSALMDGELSPRESERVLDAMLADPALRERWAEWQRVSAALAGQHPDTAGDLAARVRDAVAAEPAPAAPTPLSQARTTRARRGGGRRVLALAASAAAVAVIVTVIAGRDAAPPAPPPVAQAPPDTAAPAAVQSAGGPAGRMAWDDARPAVSKRLNAYLLNHSDYLSDGVRGLLAYARVVGYDGAE